MNHAPSYRTRSARAADLPWLPTIERAAGSLFPAGRVPDPAATYPADGLRTALDAGLLLVADDPAKSRPVGFAVCSVLDDQLHLEELSVHPDHGRRGLGRRLVENVLSLAASRGHAAVTLTTFADLPWNAPFYARLGFEVLAETATSQALADRLAAEAELGLTLRVAMRRPVQAAA